MGHGRTGRAQEEVDPLVARLKFFVSALVLLILGWSLAFMAVEGRSFTDAFYYTIVTVTTVGYGDIHPESTAGKMMAILIILTGTGTVRRHGREPDRAVPQPPRAARCAWRS